MNHRANYRTNEDHGLKHLPKLTGSVTIVNDKLKITRTNRTSAVKKKMFTDDEKCDGETDRKKLREIVLNRLWDSLPPETQVFEHLEAADEDSDSDATESGLDAEDEEEKKSVRDSAQRPESSKSSSISCKKMQDKFPNLSDSHKNRVPGDKSDFGTEGDTASVSWDINIDFIQSIIWLKSTTAKLQRVPADEFLRVFKTQWELSQEMKANESTTQTGQPEVAGFSDSVDPIPRVNDLEKKTDSMKYLSQRDRVELIRNRLASCNITRSNEQDHDVIPDTDEEGEIPSPQSSQLAAGEKSSTIINVKVLDSMGNSSCIDSGFNSEKPESTEARSSSLMTENMEGIQQQPSNRAKDRPKLLATRSFGTRERNNPFRKLGGVKTSGGITPKRKHTSVLKTKFEKRSRLSISSATLNYVLRSSECNKLLVNSVRTILKTLENERYGLSSVKNDWNGSVEKEAIDAIVSVIDQLDEDKGSNSCRNEAVETIKRVLDNMLHSNEVDKQTIWEHHRLVILELCNSASVCTEVVNQLMLRLENLIPVVRQTNEVTMEKSVEVIGKSSIIFHALKITLNKYRLFGSSHETVANGINAADRIPEVTDLWKRNWRVNNKDCDIFATGLAITESRENPREVWIRVLEELVVASTTVWPLVKILAWKCLVTLK